MDAPPVSNPEGAIAGALARPLGAPSLAIFVEPGDRVAVLQDASLPRELRDLAAGPIAAALEAAGAAEVRWLVVEPGPARPDAAEGAGVPFEAPAGAGAADLAEGAPGRPAEGFVAVGRAPRLGVVRLAAKVARADRLILVGRCTRDPDLGAVGAGSLVAWGSAAPSTRAALLGLAAGPPPAGRDEPGASAASEVAARPSPPAAIESVLLLSPPAFALLLLLQASGRITGVLAGDALAVTDACAGFLDGR
ncbi:MAG TPA: hypothetical protein VN033_09690 [Vulgatibacter sp.]|nr:hypothetical protein [Vulgatibacter sp.]